MEKKLATAYSELKNACTEKGIKIAKDFNINPLDDTSLENFVSISDIDVYQHLTNGELDSICWGIDFDSNVGKAIFDNMIYRDDYYDKGVYGCTDKSDIPNENLEKIVDIIKDITQAIKSI